MNFGVLGSGSWGTAMAQLLGDREEVYLWGRREDHVKQIQNERVNEEYLPDVELPRDVRATSDLQHVLENADVLIVAVPSHAFRELIGKINHPTRYRGVVVLTKGFDPETGERLSEIYRSEAGSLENYFLLTGPSHAREVAEERPTSVVLGGGHDREQRERFQELLYRNYFRVYTNPDLIGLEMGGALKNVIAIASGVSDGLGYGVNARAALITRGMHELRSLSEAEGAEPGTMFGLSGLGDLIVTATSDLSRNYRFGVQLARGRSVDEAKDEVGQIVEGINTTKIARERAGEYGVRAPLVRQIYRVIYENVEPVEAVEQLMEREARPEFSRENGGHSDVNQT